eukprot:TRINITY_DN19695_c0_g1_i4.p1 TRINITY_DN19695_c0_g1~~TRINITY_DN19695_c0_g1_i4.p1  ORF type:complete len:754 (+),score=176.17 TRINITY_DN19695_c0_g1_i4:39-2300(+)
MSVEEELWPNVLDGLTQKLKKINLPHQVANVKTFEGKIAKVLENLTVRQKIATFISKCAEVHHMKNGSTASRLRDKGNEKFKLKDNEGALKLYTESIICAPEFGPELSLAFGNRSATHFQFGDWSAALCDINMALKNRYPRNLEYKILQRKAQCLIRLGSFTQALEVLDSCEKAISAAKLKEDKVQSVNRDLGALRQELATLLAKQQKTSKPENSSEKPPEYENDRLPHANPNLNLKDSKDRVRGRYVVTEQDVAEGEILFSEPPYSAVLLPEQYSTHCHHCYAKYSAPMPCRKCTQPRYCSVECVEAASSVHQHECGQLDLLHSVGIGHLAVRTVLVTGMERLKELRPRIKAGNYEYSIDDAYSRVYSLMHHADKMKEDETFQYTVTAALLAMYLAKRTKFIFPNNKLPPSPASYNSPGSDSDMDEELVSYVGGLILRHLCQLVGNAHAITEVKESDNGAVQQVRLATAIYPSASMMNHCCVPNIINQFAGNRLLVRATRTIKAGQEVFNCYGPHYRRHTYAERQEMLLLQYKFRCQCVACSDPKERNFLKQFEARLCDVCNGPVIENQCQDCDRVVKNTNYEDEIDVVVSRILQLNLNNSRHSNNNNNTSSRNGGGGGGNNSLQLKLELEVLESCEKKLANLLFKHNYHLAKVRDMLAKNYTSVGDLDKAATYIKKSLETTEARYGPGSIEAGHELLKYSDLLLAQKSIGLSVDSKHLLQVLGQARNIFLLNYGESSRYCTELQTKILSMS